MNKQEFENKLLEPFQTSLKHERMSPETKMGFKLTWERMEDVEKSIKDLNESYYALDKSISSLSVDVKNLHIVVQELRADLKDSYVTNEVFRPVKVAVFGLIGMIVTGVFGSLITLVVK